MSPLLEFETYCKCFLKIETKEGETVPLILRPYQKRMVNEILDLYYSGVPVRVIILKARQMGISTVIAALLFWLSITNFNRTGVLIADVAKRTDAVFGIYKHYWYHLPNKMRPMIGADNERLIHWQNPQESDREKTPGLNSKIKAETAQDPNAGRSATAQFAHKTEAAYFPYPGQIEAGLGGSIPYAKGTMIIDESTANGIAGPGAHYHTKWTQAVDGANDYHTIFIAWYEADEYEFEVEKGFRLTAKEIELDKAIADYSEDWAQFDRSTIKRKLNWRRKKINEYKSDPNQINDPEDVFDQEFPWCPEVAFLSSGSPVFDTKKLAKQISAMTTKPSKTIDLKNLFDGTLLEHYMDKLKLYELPKNNVKYVVSADVAEGVEGGDASDIRILTGSLREVANWHGQVDPDELGLLMIVLGKLYNDALLAPEVNNMGYATIAAIKNQNYPNIYIVEKRDEHSDKITKKIGWYTTRKTKLPMIANLKSLHREDEVTIRDIDLLREMATITRADDGNVSINGKDRVAAMCIACEAAKQVNVTNTGKHNATARIEKSLEQMTIQEKLKHYANKKKKESYYD